MSKVERKTSNIKHTIVISESESIIDKVIEDALTFIVYDDSNLKDLRNRLLEQNFASIITYNPTEAVVHILDATTTIFSCVTIIQTTDGKRTLEIVHDEPSRSLKVNGKNINPIYSYREIYNEFLTPYQHSKKHQRLIEKNIQTQSSIEPRKIHQQPILSIGIPSYNVGKYIQNTLASIICHPDLKDVEIIVVNDGSSDNTAGKVQQMQQLAIEYGHRPIILVNKKNGGHGSTINTAIRRASGKYFKLLDGDDYLSTEDLVKLIGRLYETTSDLILTNYIEDVVEPAGFHPIRNYTKLRPKKPYDLEKKSTSALFTEKGPLLSTITCRTSLLKSPELNIDENCFYVDMEFNYYAYSRSAVVEYMPLDIYVYYIGRAGQSMSKVSLVSNWRDHERVCRRLLSDYHSNSLSDTKRQFIEKHYINPICRSQYAIALEYATDRTIFNQFDGLLKRYSNFYNSSEIAGNVIKFHRLTRGWFIRFNPLFYRLRKTLSTFSKNMVYNARVVNRKGA